MIGPLNFPSESTILLVWDIFSTLLESAFCHPWLIRCNDYVACCTRNYPLLCLRLLLLLSLDAHLCLTIGQAKLGYCNLPSTESFWICQGASGAKTVKSAFFLPTHSITLDWDYQTKVQKGDSWCPNALGYRILMIGWIRGFLTSARETCIWCA